MPGEALTLVSAAGQATPWRVVLGGTFSSNGLRNGGLQRPGSKLGKLAVGTATQDYFFISKDAESQGLSITGLDPARNYRLRLFASRAWDQEIRVTLYTVTGAAGATSGTLRTSGKDIGSDGAYDGNDDTVATLDNLRPDAWGKLHLTMEALSGAFAYLSLIEISVL